MANPKQPSEPSERSTSLESLLPKRLAVALANAAAALLGALLGAPLAPSLSPKCSDSSKPMTITHQVIVGANVWTEESLTKAVARGIEEGRKLQVDLGKPVSFVVRQIREDVWQVSGMAEVPGQPSVP